MTGRGVLVVGASSGIGLATALRLAAAGDRLVLAARDPQSLTRAADMCRAAGASEVEIIPGDAGSRSDVEGMVSTAEDALGGLDAVVHTATVMAYGRIEDLPPDVFTTVVDTAVHGTFHLAQVVLPVFRRQGHGTLVIVNSLLGSVTVPNMGAYATSKWGQRAVVRTLQQETRGDRDVHVCLVSPGSINTPVYYQAANYMGNEARPPIPVLQPEKAGEVIAQLLDKPRGHVSIPVGPANPIVVVGYRFVPAIFDLLVGPLFKLAAVTRDKRSADKGNVLTPHPAGDRLRGRWPES